MTRVLVTGSTGGLGANLVEALNRRGFEVVGLRRSTSPTDAIWDLEMETVIGDILEPDTLPAALDGVAWVFHAAAIADDWHYPARVVYRTNVEGTRNVLAAAMQAGVERVVFTSSAMALGAPSPGKPLLNEGDHFNLDPRYWPYGYSKHLAEQVLAEFVAQGMHAVTVLPSAIMGPRDVKFISGELLVRVLKRQVFPLPHGGLNFIDMRDCAEAHIAAAERGRPGERYVLAGHNVTHREALRVVGDVIGVEPRIVTIPPWVLPPLARLVALLHRVGIHLIIDPGRILMSSKFMYYDNSKAVRELGLSIRPLVDSVRDAYRWYLQSSYLEKRGVRVHPQSMPGG